MPKLPTFEGLVFFGCLGTALVAVSVLEKFGVNVNEGAVKVVLTCGTIVGILLFIFRHSFFRSVLVGF